MELNESQKKMIARWADEGCSLGELQKRINDEFGLSLTFMEVRLLALDNGITLKDRRVSTPGSVDVTRLPPPEEPAAGGAAGEMTGRVSIELDRLKKPGALINGTVTFSDGVSATWFLDQSGRLGINPNRRGYRPSESDLRAFQEELSALLQSRGF